MKTLIVLISLLLIPNLVNGAEQDLCKELIITRMTMPKQGLFQFLPEQDESIEQACKGRDQLAIVIENLHLIHGG
jgi:hypothetical protein